MRRVLIFGRRELGPRRRNGIPVEQAMIHCARRNSQPVPAQAITTGSETMEMSVDRKIAAEARCGATP